MTQEQYYWFIRRQQLLNAYNLQQQKVAGAGKQHEREIKSNLKEIWLDDFDEQFDIIPADNASQLFSKFSNGACSSVRSGNFHARNFDFTFDEGITYVVHVKEKITDTKRRYKFGGIAKATFNDVAPTIRQIPNLMKDGINECGVVVNINVVSKIDLDNAGKANDETHKGSDLPRVHIDCVPAYLLSYASSAVDAVNIMKEKINIYGYLKGKNPESDEYLHYMISDEKNTFVVEIIGNQLYVIGYSSNDENDNILVNAKVDETKYPYPIMTNWYLNYDELPISALCADNMYTYHGCGIERYRILSSNYESLSNDMSKLMKKARYTNEIIMDISAENFPFSDATGMSIFDYNDYLNPELSALSIFINEDREKMKTALETNDRTQGIWITSHNTVYNIKDRTFSLIFEEDYKNPPMQFSI